MMSHPIYLAVALAIGIAIGSLLLGRQISLVVDRCFPRGGLVKPTDPISIEFDPEGISSRIVLGTLTWPLSWPWPPGACEVTITADPVGRLALHADARSFTFGPIQKSWTEQPKPQYQIIPEPGDTVTFTRCIGRLPWPTPFTFNLLGGPAPKWKRFVYNRLRWTKTSAASLEIIWRSEEWFLRNSGWADTYQNRLARITIHVDPVTKAVAAYLAKTRGWTGREYRLETISSSSTADVVSAVCHEDQTANHPGGGESIALHVDKSSRKVLRESAFQ